MVLFLLRLRVSSCQAFVFEFFLAPYDCLLSAPPIYLLPPPVFNSTCSFYQIVTCMWCRLFLSSLVGPGFFSFRFAYCFSFSSWLLLDFGFLPRSVGWTSFLVLTSACQIRRLTVSSLLCGLRSGPQPKVLQCRCRSLWEDILYLQAHNFP